MAHGKIPSHIGVPGRTSESQGTENHPAIRTGTEQDKMFERYAPIQRAVKPKVWKEAIDRAMALHPSQWPSMPAPAPDENGIVNAPRSMRLWQQRHPDRYDRLQRVRRVITSIAEDTRTPAEMIIKPQILRNLCWVENPAEVDVEEFLIAQGARIAKFAARTGLF